MCRKIYKNHRQALRLVFERFGSEVSEVVEALEEMVQSRQSWHCFNRKQRSVQFIPREWLSLFPPISKRRDFDARIWVTFNLRLGDRSLRLTASAWPTKDDALRRKTLTRLTQNPKEFGLKLSHRQKNNAELGRWLTLANRTLLRWPEEEMPQADEIVAQAGTALDQLKEQVSPIADALRPIIAEWVTKQQAKPTL